MGTNNIEDSFSEAKSTRKETQIDTNRRRLWMMQILGTEECTEAAESTNAPNFVGRETLFRGIQKENANGLRIAGQLS